MKGFLCLLFLFFNGLAISQSFYFRQEPTLVIDELQEISLIFQAHDQLIWLGTDRGIFWYDGRRYRPMARPDNQVRKVTCIAENRNGEIWAGYEDGYLHAMTPRGYKMHIPADSLSGTAISKIRFSETDQIFITTYGKGIWTINEGKLTRLTFGALAGIDDVYDALFDRQGRLWLATDNGIWVYHALQPESLVHFDQQNGLPDEIVTQLEMADNGDVWIGLYDHGLARYRMELDTIVPLMSSKPSSGNVIGLCKGRAGEWWVATDKNITRYSLGAGKFEIELPGEMQNRIEYIRYDINGHLWVASGNKLFIADTRFEFVSPGITGIQAIAVSGDQIWMGCETGLYAMNRSDQVVSRFVENEKMNILSLYIDPFGLIWIGTFGQGLFCYDPATNRRLHLTEKDGISNNSILNIDGHDNTIWLATLGGITELNWQNNPFTSKLLVTGFYDKFSFPEGYVYDVFAGSDGQTWFGTDGKGLYRYHKGHFGLFESIPDTTKQFDHSLKTIYSIAAGSENSIWISGAKGQILNLDASGKIRQQYRGNLGMINSLVSSGEDEVLMIREGEIEIRNRFGQLNLYGESSGLNSFNPTINAAVKDTDGSVWIAHSDRLLHYMPIKQDSLLQVRMQLRGATPASLLSGHPVRLRADSNFIDIRYTGLWYQDPGSVRYRYMLKGHDQDWIYTQDLRAVYSSLAPGEYTFIVEGSHNDDFSKAQSLTRVFVILPPFYFTWWFIAGVSLLVTWMTYSYIKGRIKRINKLHELEKEKTMLRLHALQAQVNPHFLFNSFNTLSGIIEEDQQAAVDYVDQLSGFFRGVLMHRNADLIRIEEELEIVRYYTYLLQKRYGSNLQIAEKIEQKTGWIAPLSIQLLVENAIKHNIVSAERPLTISITIDAHWVEVSNPIQPKVNASTESTGFGLSSLVTRYQYLTKEETIIRQEQNTFTVRIPVIPNEKPI